MKTVWTGRCGQNNRRGGPAARRRGSLLTLTALAMVALCGFCALAADYGRAVLVKNQLQRACDAAALAGVKYLPLYPETATTAAIYFAARNDVTIDATNIQFLNSNMRIRVTKIQNVKFFFGPVVKIISGDVGARATAAVQQRDNFVPPYVAPIAVTPTTYNIYKDGTPTTLEIIRYKSETLGLNDMVLLDLNSAGHGPANMANQLQWGGSSNGPVAIGSMQNTLNSGGNAQSKFFYDAMMTRLTAAAGPPWYDDGTKFTNIPVGSPRLMNIIVTPDTQTVNRADQTLVVGFVPIYVEKMEMHGRVIYLRIRFLPLTSVGGGSYTDANPLITANTILRITRLVD